MNKVEQKLCEPELLNLSVFFILQFYENQIFKLKKKDILFEIKR